MGPRGGGVIPFHGKARALSPPMELRLFIFVFAQKPLVRLNRPSAMSKSVATRPTLVLKCLLTVVSVDPLSLPELKLSSCLPHRPLCAEKREGDSSTQRFSGVGARHVTDFFDRRVSLCRSGNVGRQAQWKVQCCCVEQTQKAMGNATRPNDPSA